MSLKRLQDEAGRFPDLIEATFISLYTAYHDLELADQGLIELFDLFGVDVDELPILLKNHYEAQSKIAGQLAKALDIQRQKYPEILAFVTGSIAKLEYVGGVSDIDILPLVIRDGVSKKKSAARHSLPADRKFEAYRNDLIKNLSEVGIRINKKKIDIAGIPLANNNQFYSNNDLLGKLGDFDEPSWAISHRGSLIFECAYQQAESVTAEKLRADVADTCDIPTDFNELEFPLSAATLLSFVRLSGIIPKLRIVRKTYGVVREAQQDATATAKTQRAKRKENEILKALFGRVWNSVIHLVTLHILFWCARIKPDEFEIEYWDAQKIIGRSPAAKLLIIMPRAIGHLRSHLRAFKNWHEDYDIKLDVASTIEETLERVYRKIGPGTVQTEGGITALPMAQIYLSFLVLSGQGRRDAIELNQEMVQYIVGMNTKLFDLLENCEKISLLLTKARPAGPSELIKLFGREVFDRQLIKSISG